MKRTLLLLAVLAAGLRPGPALAATTPRGLVVDDLTIAPPGNWHAGSLLARAEIRNPTATDQRVRIRYGSPGQSSSWSRLGGAETELLVPAGGRSLAELPIPRCNSGHSTLSAVDASGRETRLSGLQSFARWGAPKTLFYVSRSLSGETLRTQFQKSVSKLEATGRFKPHAGPSAFNGVLVARAGDFADPWPGDWRAYSVFAAVFVAERDVPDLPAPAKAALRDYAAAGGCVLFPGAAEVPAEFADAPLAALAAPGPDSSAFDPVPPLGGAAADGAAAPPLPARRCGLGLFAALPEAVARPGAAEALPDDLAAFLLRHAIRAEDVLESTNELADKLAGGNPIGVALGRPPVGTFLLLLAAFAILAGPVTLFVLARKNRRIHVLWILPAVSAVFSAAILLSLLVREGVRPTLARRVGVLLDQRAGRAVSIASEGLYSPLSIGAVDLPADAAVAPGDGLHGDVQVGRTARYDGWVAPRTTGRFDLAAVRATPLRLDVREDPATGAVEVVNAFGAPVDKLFLLDGSGTLRTAAGLAPGATVAPAPAGETAKSDLAPHLTNLREALAHGDVPLKLDALVRPETPARRFYVAVLPAAPFTPDPLPGRKAKRDEKTVVYGVY